MIHKDPLRILRLHKYRFIWHLKKISSSLIQFSMSEIIYFVLIVIKNFLNPNWHEEGYFPCLVLFGSDLSAEYISKMSEPFLEVKNDINWVNLTSCQAHWVIYKMSLGGAKDEHSSYWPNVSTNPFMITRMFPHWPMGFIL